MVVKGQNKTMVVKGQNKTMVVKGQNKTMVVKGQNILNVDIRSCLIGSCLIWFYTWAQLF